jgi:histidinol-phosphatase (PHP family)
MRYYDYHTHSNFSEDGTAAPEQMIESAIKFGMTEIAITDHFDIFDPDVDPFTYLDVPAYFGVLHRLEEEYSESIRVVKGVELGMQPGKINEIYDQILREYPFDFVIASVHIAKGEWIDYDGYLGPRTYEEAIRDYYEELLEDIKNFKNYDVLGHINNIDRYIPRVPNREEYLHLVEPILREVIKDGKGIEFNTSSFRYGLGEHTTPTQDTIELYAKLGGKIITTGSDAHIPSGIGDHFDTAYAQIKKAGLSSITTFKDRQPTQITI